MATVTKSIGTSSRDYSTIAAWEADLDSSSIYSSGDDAVGELYNDSVFVEDIDIDGGGSIGLDTITLTSSDTEGNRHRGIKNSGPIVRHNSASRDFIEVAGNATVDSVTISFIEFDGDDDSVSNGDDKHCIKYTGATEFYFQNNLLHSWGSGQDASDTRTFKVEGDKTVFTNNFIFNINGGSGHTWYVFMGNSSSAKECLILNNTFYDIDKQSASNSYLFSHVHTHANSRIRNNVIMDENLTAVIGTGSKHGSAVTDYVCYDASSLTGFTNVVEDTSSNAFSDNTASDPNLHLKSISNCIDAGVDLGASPTNVAVDIDGRNRHTEEDTWDLGADEYTSASITGKRDGFLKPNYSSRIAFILVDPSSEII